MVFNNEHNACPKMSVKQPLHEQWPKEKGQKDQTIFDITLHRKLKIEQWELH
jgi:hypothetical protein